MKVRVSILALLVAGSLSSVALAADPPAPKADATAKVETKIDDPMLEPVPPAAKNIANWSEARDHLRARSTDYRTAIDDVTKAEGAWRVALAAALPQISLTGQATQNILPDVSNRVATVSVDAAGKPTPLYFKNFFIDGSAQAGMSLVDLRAWYAIGTANRNVDAAKWTVQDTKRILLLGVVSSMVAVYTAERVAEIGRLGLRNALERLELTKQRVTLGAGNKLDVLRVETDVATARATLVSNNEALRQAREALGMALGYPTAIGVAPSLSLDAVENEAASVCKGVGKLEERPDIVAADKRIEAAERARTEVNLSYLPTLNVGTGVNMSTQTAAQFTWSIQGTLNFQLWDGGARYGNAKTTAALSDQALQRREAAIRKATIELTQAKRAVTVSEDSRRVAQQAREAAFETDRLTRTSYTEGRGTSLELVSAATALRQADVNLALREFELVRARLLASLTLSRCDL